MVKPLSERHWEGGVFACFLRVGPRHRGEGVGRWAGPPAAHPQVAAMKAGVLDVCKRSFRVTWFYHWIREGGEWVRGVPWLPWSLGRMAASPQRPDE